MSGILGASNPKAKSGVIDKWNGVKVWVNFDGDDGSVRDSYNVSSVARQATGDYIINFASNLPSGNYSMAGFCGGAALNVIGGRNVEGYNLVSSTRIGVRDASAEGWVDTTLVTLIIIMD